MDFMKENRWVLPTALFGLFMVLTVIMALCTVPVAMLIFAVLAAVMIVAAVLNLDSDEADIAKFAWLIFPVLELISMLIYKGSGGQYSWYRNTAWMSLAACFGLFGATEFVTLLLAKKCWKTSHVLIAGAVLLVFSILWAAIGAEALTAVFATYAGVIALLASILLQIYISNQFKQAAKDKGYEGRQYFWLVFFLPLIGMILVAALPDKNVTSAILRLANDSFAKPEVPETAEE